MTESEQNLIRGSEGHYVFHERLGMLIDGTRMATPEEIKIAEADARAAVDRLINL